MAIRKSPGYLNALNTPERQSRLQSFLNRFSTGVGGALGVTEQRDEHPFLQLQKNLSAQKEDRRNKLIERRQKLRPMGNWRKWQEQANATFTTGQ